MDKTEEKIVTWICDNGFVLLLVFSTLLSCAARFGMRNFISVDMKEFLLPWFESIRERGGLLALGTGVGNYNIPYQTLIALLTYIPMRPEFLYKISSSLFDFAQGVIIYKLVLDVTKDKKKAIISYALAINFPTVMMNSALWGQCDSIYTTFCLVSLLMCLKGRYHFAFISIGIAFAFKLQAVFFVPYLIFKYITEKKFSILYFLWIPVVMFLLSLGGIIQGLPVLSIVKIYFQQANENYGMYANYPSIWALLMRSADLDVFEHMRYYGIIFTMLILTLLGLSILQKIKGELTGKENIKIAFLLSYATVLFLPAMHERYGYLYMMIGMVMVFVEKELRPLYMILFIIDMIAYSVFLFGSNVSWTLPAGVNLLCFGAFTYLILRSLCSKTQINGKDEEQYAG